jgi:hypothetical protein
MDGTAPELEALTARERSALRKLLVAAVAAAGRPDRLTELRIAVERAPITALPAAADLHRVTGIVLRGLTALDAVPDEVRGVMEAARVRSSLHHLTIVGALSRVAQEFDAVGLSWLVMKGPVAAGMLYPDAGDRGYADLDLVVARQDFPTAMAILEHLGYRSSILNWSLAERMLAGQIEMKVPAVNIDLHWDFYYSREDREPFALVAEEMLTRTRMIDAGGLKMPTFDAPDTLITLAVHAARSGGHRLLWLKDVERAIAVDRPDLDEVVRRSRSYGCGPSVGIILGRAQRFLGADVPSDIHRALVPPALRGAEATASRLVHPVQLHDRETVTRWLARSMRSSAIRTIGSMPGRAGRLIAKKVRPPSENETDDHAEKQSYLSAVTNSRPRSSAA